MPAMVISVEVVCVDNVNLLGYLNCEVAVEEPEIETPDPSILIDNNCMDDKLHSGIPVGSGDFEDERDEGNAIPTASWRQRAVTKLERVDLVTSDVNRYEGEDGDDGDVNEEEEASQDNDGSTQNVEY